MKARILLPSGQAVGTSKLPLLAVLLILAAIAIAAALLLRA